MNQVLFVGVGGCIGSVLRYLLSNYVQQLARNSAFPYGTLAVNVLGCFVIGWLSCVAESRNIFTPETRAFVFVGLLGGFTTFSSFGNETINLWRNGTSFAALANIGAQLVLGLGAVWLGRAMAALIWR